MENIMERYFNTNTSGTDNVEDLQFNLTDWKAQLKDPASAEIACLLKTVRNPIDNGTLEGPHCNATWDGLFCWPATPVNHLVEIPCLDLVLKSSIFDEKSVQGTAFRFCTNDTTWVQNGYSNYSVCVQELKRAIMKVPYTLTLEALQPYILFVGCLISIICLISFIIFYGCLRSTLYIRVIILLNIMVALLGRSVLWIVIVGPSIFHNFFDYRYLAWTCNVVISLHFYTLLVTAFWMVVLAHYLNQKLMKKHSLRDKFPRVRNMLLAWVLPATIVALWASLTATFDSTTCWISYTKSKLFWIISIPLVGAFMINLIYLINILRVFVKRISLIRSPTQQTQIRSARRDIIILFPVLGINHLLFLYNPGGEIAKYYMFFHAVFQSVQGIIVSLLCCYLSTDVRKNIWKGIRSCCVSGVRFEANRNNLNGNAGQRKRVSFAEGL